MIHNETNLEVADNSGARRVQCIKVLGGSKRKFASVGDIIIVSIKEAIPKGKVSKGDVHQAVIVRTAKKLEETMEVPLDLTKSSRANKQAIRTNWNKNIWSSNSEN